ncbi:L-dehydroascorbate transporter large permease subunit [Pararhizobium polonicum]|jgi:tripartite ATP-independent transporter DctM subunit|uniref:TRAP transporter large permease protein n=1 Tax=Pararhizobium polonicum TaxID=1612624 RepID=A0A1C7P3N7_9HYPH|nr:TRAP transporter large permease subunit [Pararhizobium polonicum]OBZ95839.1 L-dehydroascorbate transporter large permease subunit [Pararhizobium polonicum]
MTILIFVTSLLAAMAIGMPIAYALIICGVALMLQLDIFDAQILAQNLVGGTDSFTLLAVPFFMLAGEVMNVGGLSRRIVDLALALVGHVRGGLGYVAIIAACILSALSGSAAADAAALGALLVPMMVRAGHDKARSAGLVASASIIGPIIPPSIAFILLGVTANLSISKLFMAGIAPGLMVGLALAIAWYIVARKEKTEPRPRASAAERLKALRESLWALGLPVIIIFGLKFGLFTPTEAAVVAAIYALFVSMVVYRELTIAQLYKVFVTSAKITSVVIFMVSAALVSAWLITIADLPGQVVALLSPFMDSPRLLMLMIMILIVIVGTAMDMAPTILILGPVLVPVVQAAGIDPIYFGVLFIINNSIGLITPPVGTVLNVVAGVTRTSMETVIRGVTPFMIAQLIVLGLMIVFPELVTVPAAWLSH